MNLKRVVVGLFVVAGVVALPASASAMSFVSAEGSPLSIDAPNDVINDTAVGDFNFDDAPDLAAVGDSNLIHVFLNENDGTGQLVPADGSPFGGSGDASGRSMILAGAFNDDEYDDLLVGTFGPNKFETYLANSDGSFPASPSHTVTLPDVPPTNDGFTDYTHPASIADVNHDSLPDLIVGMTTHAIDVALGNADGSFTPAPQVNIPITTDDADADPFGDQSDRITRTTIGDYNGDEDPDVAMVMRSETNPQGDIYVANGHGDGTFTPEATNPVLAGGFQKFTDIKTIDLNDDVFDDVVLIQPINTPSTQYQRTMLGSATGLVLNTNPNGHPYPGGFPQIATVADMNNDGDQDVLTTLDGNSFGVTTSDGAGGLSVASGGPFDLSQIGGKNINAHTIQTADFNGDGFMDVVESGSHSGDPNQGRGIDVQLQRSEPRMTPFDIDFPDTQPGQTSAAMQVNVKNVGGPDINIEEFSMDDQQEVFAFDASDCPVTLEAGDDCDVDVTFSPDVHGVYGGTLFVSFDDGSSRQASLNGKTGEPEATITPAEEWDFGPAVAGFPAGRATKSFTVTSTGTSPVAIAETALFDGDTDDFKILNPTACTGSLAPGATCQLNLAFEPKAGTIGPRETVFVVNADFDEGPLFVELSGTATTMSYTISPVTKDFGSVQIGSKTPRPVGTFTVTSTGTGDLTLDQKIEGPDASSYKTKDKCFAAGQPQQQSCIIKVEFDPQPGAAGTRTAKLVLNDGLTKREVSLTGTATAAAVQPKPVLSLKLKAKEKANRGKTLVVKATVKNTGNATANSISLKTTVPKKLAKKVKAVKIASLAAGKSVTKKIKVKVKKSAKKGKKLKVKVAASASGAATKSAKRTAKIG